MCFVSVAYVHLLTILFLIEILLIRFYFGRSPCLIFEVRGANALILGGTAGINFSPLVSFEERPGWEAYAQENLDQYNMSMAVDNAGRLAQDKRLGLQENNDFECYSDSFPWRNDILDFAGFHDRSSLEKRLIFACVATNAGYSAPLCFGLRFIGPSFIKGSRRSSSRHRESNGFSVSSSENLPRPFWGTPPAV